MPRQPSFVHAQLRLADLATKTADKEKLLSIRLPTALLRRLDDVCRTLRVRKSEVVVAMLNEGLERYRALGHTNGQRKVKLVRRTKPDRGAAKAS